MRKYETVIGNHYFDLTNSMLVHAFLNTLKLLSSHAKNCRKSYQILFGIWMYIVRLNKYVKLC